MASMNAQTATEANVASSATSVTVFSAKSSALARTVYNDSTSVLYLKFSSAAASATSYTVQLASNDYYEFPQPLYGGQVTGIWSSANGNARTTEVTA